MSAGFPKVVLGDLATFNMQHGFCEASVRGMRSGFLGNSSCLL